MIDDALLRLAVEKCADALGELEHAAYELRKEARIAGAHRT